MIRPKRLVKLYCVFPNKLVELVAATLQDIGAVHLIDVKDESKSLKTIKAGYHDELYEIAEHAKKLKNEVETASIKAAFEWLIGPRYVPVELGRKKAKDAIKDAKSLSREISKKYGKVNAQNAGEIKRVYYHKLLTVVEHLDDLKEKAAAISKFGSTKYTASFAGFAAKEDAPKVKDALDRATNGRCVLEVKDAASEDNAPSMLSNPSIIKPFEILTENYGMPPYDAIDPTFILAATFILLFGLMFPDAGYGIVLVLLSLAVYLITRKTTKFIRSTNIILIYCGLSSVLFGFLFGEFLGGFIEIKAYLFEPTRDILAVLLISILIGVMHTSIGLASNMLIGKKRLHHAALLAALWSVLLFAYTRQNAYAWAFFAAIALLFYAKGAYMAEEIMALFTRVLSYLRVGILSVAHITISRLLVQAASALPKNIAGIAVGVLLIAVGVLISFAIGVLVVFIQSLRLHWLEFFGAYEFGGKRFEAFSHKREYLYTL